MTPITALLLIVGLLVAWSLIRLHRDPAVDFNLLDLLTENNKVSKISAAFMLVLGVTTWVIVKLAVTEKLTEGYLTIYVGAWVAPLVARVVFNKRDT